MRDQSLIELHRRLMEVLGDDHALTLMTYLPQDEVATRTDLTSFRVEMDLRFEAFEHRLKAFFHEELNKTTRTLALANATTMATLTAIAFAAARLI